MSASPRQEIEIADNDDRVRAFPLNHAAAAEKTAAAEDKTRTDDKTGAEEKAETGQGPSQQDVIPEVKDVRVVNTASQRRKARMITAACCGTVLVVAGGVFWISPFNPLHAGRLRSHVVTASASPVVQPDAPAARLARAPLPAARQSAYAGSVPDDVREFQHFRAVQAAAPPKKQVLASTVRAKQGSPAKGITQTASNPVAPITSVSKPSAVATPISPSAAAHGDPAVIAATIRPAPMSPPQQIQVLDLVAQLGTLIRNQRDEIAQLRNDQQRMQGHVDATMDDFRRRIALSEARRAVSGAFDADPHAAPRSSSGSPKVKRTAVTTPAVASATPAIDMAAYRYHVQAASPGLAMLSELDASGGEARQLPISPGDIVPGWGKVISISQRGTAWVVKTDHGLIQ